jgi:hypothetical protein
VGAFLASVNKYKKTKKTRIPCIGLLSPSIGPPSPSIGGGRRSSNLQPPRRIHTMARQICRRREGGRAPERNHPYIGLHRRCGSKASKVVL